MKWDILTGEAEMATLAPEWKALQERAGRSIFTGPEWCEGWWRHIGSPAGFVLHIVTGRRDGRLVALAALSVVRRKGVRLLEWAGSEVCDYSDFLLEDAADAAALWNVVRKSPHFDLARIKEVRPQAACLSALEDFARQTRTTQARAIKLVWPTFDAWLASLPYAARKQYRARVKQAGAIAPLRFEIVREGPAFDAALEALMAQKTAWAKALGKHGVFDAPGAGAFFRHVAEAEGRSGRLHLSVLKCGEDIIATHLGFVEKGVFMSYMPSYSAAHGELSPGRIMFFKCVGWALENGCTEYDFMRGEEGYKNQFANDARELKDFMFARTLRGRFAQFMYLRRKA